MRIATYGKRGEERVGVLKDSGTLVDLDRARKGNRAHDTLRSFLSESGWTKIAEDLVDESAGLPEDCLVKTAGKRLGSVAAGASKIVAIGANTWSHMREASSLTRSEPSREPFIIAKFPSSACGPYDDVVKPSWVTSLDYEVELGVVIGKKCIGAAKGQSMEYVGGYTVINDFTARDIQIDPRNQFYNQHTLSKSLDTFCPAGPHLVTKDEIGDPAGLSLRLTVNGELRQKGSISDLIFDIPTLVSFVSKAVTLYPGDVILTGSPAGVAYFMQPQRFLGPRDEVSASIDHIGELRNRIVGG